MNQITVIIPTFNEELHIRRCILSMKLISSNIYIIDSFSNDSTKEIALSLGVNVLEVKWENSYAKKFNWGLNNIKIETPWVMRMDADEYLTDELIIEINQKINKISSDISGLYIKRRVYFMDKWIKYGGVYPTILLRIWRNNTGICEEKLMDEHIKLFSGQTSTLKYDLVDDNRNNLSFWTIKHDTYSIKEAADILNIIHNFKEIEEISPNFFGSQAQLKRWLKIRYASAPLFCRPFIYFIWRYFIRLGFLDGKRGLMWHFLQGFWYRFLVDAKIYEIKMKSKQNNLSIMDTLSKEYNIKL